jgi:hypothetical protein
VQARRRNKKHVRLENRASGENNVNRGDENLAEAVLPSMLVKCGKNITEDPLMESPLWRRCEKFSIHNFVAVPVGRD